MGAYVYLSPEQQSLSHLLILTATNIIDETTTTIKKVR